ncbi:MULTISPECIES: M13 family metallopeptidase [Rhodanobacter]|uniref:M13 family metallopeptidase n=1 Tax=Rhodanobacter TaxID=75309 RepID=UPI0003F4E835|nr:MULTISPECIES: M13 family metallopeptidase [Rhodanobacter]TAN18056.1 MAG: M13 family peptidase [Rhodanobacter sp.]UJJ54422.1 M13 family metallopeptidase [Rhodanobacter thiooxydans]
MQRTRWILATAILCSPAAWAATPASRSSGIDLAGIDHGVRPGDDFFRYANGEWLKTAQIPADRSSTGTFLKVFEQAEKNTAELIRDAGAGHPAAGSNARRIADYYAAWMDTAAIERHGLAPLKPELAQIDAIGSRRDLARVLGSRLRADVDPVNATHFHTQNLFGLFVTQGLEDPSRNIAYLLQGGLGMPSRDYYLSSDPHMLATRGKYLTYIGALLEQAGTADAAAKARTVLDLETKIAKAQTDLLDSQDIHKANNLWHMADFAQKAPGLDWASYFKAAGLDGQQQIDTWQPNAVTGLSALVASEPLPAWKDLLLFHTLNQSAGLLPKAYADLSFDFYGRTLQGTPQQQPRWKRAVGATSGDLGDAVGQLYVKHYFPASSKVEIEQLVKNLIAAFNDRIDTLSWMTPATREKAKAKLATLRVGVGYPDSWRDYGSLQIRADDALGNQLRAGKFEYEHQRAKLGQSVDKNEWWMTPQTVNALNLPLQNALNFPAAILQPPFFDPHADAAANYGAIGSVIGHEISHSFDNMGAEFDAEGRLANWWTPEDLAHFKAAGQQLAKQFDQYEALPGLHVNGEQTLGENIADVSGLTIAWLAYRKSLDGKPAPVIDGLTGDQRFFLAYGQAWRSKIRDAAQRQRLATDVHAPADFRAQTVRNLDAWYPTFDVKPGEKLYLAPKDRVKIW